MATLARRSQFRASIAKEKKRRKKAEERRVKRNNSSRAYVSLACSCKAAMLGLFIVAAIRDIIKSIRLICRDVSRKRGNNLFLTWSALCRRQRG